MLKGLLQFASVVEAATGVALLADPLLVVGLLVGASAPAADITLGRLAGIAILALGLACWPGGADLRSVSPALRGMLLYSVLIALFLAYLYTVHHIGGPMLWPAVALHAVVSLLLIWNWRAAAQRSRE